MLQLRLFDDMKEMNLSIEDVANSLGVSTASVRNWIKTGYLNQTGQSMVSKKSYEKFKDEVAGQEKLTGRANKSLKDSHDHHTVQDVFFKITQSRSKQ